MPSFCRILWVVCMCSPLVTYLMVPIIFVENIHHFNFPEEQINYHVTKADKSEVLYFRKLSYKYKRAHSQSVSFSSTSCRLLPPLVALRPEWKKFDFCLRSFLIVSDFPKEIQQFFGSVLLPYVSAFNIFRNYKA